MLYSLPTPLLSGVGNETHFFESAEDLVNILLSIDFSQPAYGYLIFVDEIAVIFKDLFYSSYCKDFITFLTQVRKLGIFFIGTSQLWKRCDSTVRDYFRTNGQAVFCNKIFPGVTLLKFADMETAEEDSKNNLKYDVKEKKILYHTPELYESYDTHAVVSAIKKIGKKGVVTYNGN